MENDMLKDIEWMVTDEFDRVGIIWSKLPKIAWRPVLDADGNPMKADPEYGPIETALQKAGWTIWHGGECPVDENSFPIVLLSAGDTDCERASDFFWEWQDEYPGDNVIAYRIPD